MNDKRPDDLRTEKLLRAATYAAVSVAIFLAAIKGFAWLKTGSVSLLSSLVDSLLDAFASLVNFVAVHQALRPASKKFRFGRGKLEPLAALAQAAFISGSALLVLYEAGRRLVNPEPVRASEWGIGVMVVSIAATLALVTFQRHVARRSGSLAIGADQLHYTGDLLANAAVIAAIVLSASVGWLWADPVFGLAIGAFILVSAWRIAVKALAMLLDRELPDEDRKKILAMAVRHAEVVAAHDLRTRASGRDLFIQLHLELPRDMTLFRAHAIADTVEREIMDAFPNAEVIIHQDPDGLAEQHPPFAERVRE